MKLSDSRVPWSGVAVNEIVGVRDKLISHLDGDCARRLPPEIRFFADRAVPPDRIFRFLDNAADFLVTEIAIREARVWRLIRSGACSLEEVEQLFSCQLHPQKWALYYTENGGLPDAPSPPGYLAGMVPCSTMRNHGVGWQRQGHNIDIWLVTAPKPGRAWDMDSDIGHESAHAAFAPVPLFVQPVAANELPATLVDVWAADALLPQQIARLLYFYTEIAVVGIRGESRATYTRLPIEDPEELAGLLRLSDNIFPGLGFDRALHTFARNRGSFDPQQSDAVLELTAPILRLLPELNKLTDALIPPTPQELRAISDLIPAAELEWALQDRRVS